MDNSVVLDYGSKTLKLGHASNFASEDEPRVRIPSVAEVSVNGVTELHWPIERGSITNFEELESLLYYALYELLGWEYGNEGNIIVCEPLLTCKPEREQLTQLLFEVFNVTGLFIQDQCVLSLYAVGKLSGVVVDIGHGKIDISSALEGSVNTSSIRRLPFAGKDLTEYFRQLVNKQLLESPISSYDAEILKELCCKCSETPLDLQASCSSSSNPFGIASETYKLPDGQEFSIGYEGSMVAEALFSPSILGLEVPGLIDHIYEAVSGYYDASIRKQLFENLMVVGGGSTIPGLSTRLLKDMRVSVPLSVTPTYCPIPEYMQANHTLQFAPWVGGAVLAKVVLQQNHLMTKAEYDEAGPTMVHRKCG